MFNVVGRRAQGVYRASRKPAPLLNPRHYSCCGPKSSAAPNVALCPPHRLHLLLPLSPRKFHRVGVDDHHDVPAVVVRAERRLVLPADDGSDLGRETTYNLMDAALHFHMPTAARRPTATAIESEQGAFQKDTIYKMPRRACGVPRR